jgi:predicted transcriptional regulator
MKITLEIDDAVAEMLQREAKRRGATTSALVEASLRWILDEERTTDDWINSLPSWNSGGLLVDVSNRDELYRVLDRERDERLYGIRYPDDE